MVPTFNPPGDYYDTPFHWIFDASGLTDGANAQNLSLYIQAGFGDFWLRRIVGMASVVNPTTGQFQIRDASLNYIESDPMFISPASDDQAVIPEIEYPEKNAIRFDLYDVLRVDPPITGNYSQTQVLEQTDGTSLAIDGNLMVVGDLTAENGGLQTGAAYLYKLTAGVWSLIATLTASDGAAGDQFGASVAISQSGSVILVGAPEASLTAGKVYAFNLAGAEQQTITAPTSTFHFGQAIAVNDTDALIGAQNGTIEGIVYYYENGGTWTETNSFQAGTPAASDGFGGIISIHGTTAGIAATQHAYIFNLSGGTWTQTAELSPTGGDESFGQSVYLPSADTLFVGAFQEAYIFNLVAGTWALIQKVTAGSGGNFGVQLTGDESDLFVCDQIKRLCYWFTLGSGTWSLKQTIQPATSPQSGWGLLAAMAGTSVIICGDIIPG